MFGHRRPEEVTELLGVGGSAAQGEELLIAIRVAKNQIIGNIDKKRRYTQLGAIPKIVSVLMDAGKNSEDDAVIVNAADAIGSLARGSGEVLGAVVGAGAVPALTEFLFHPNKKVVNASACILEMIFQSKLAQKFDFLKEEARNFVGLLLNSDSKEVIKLAASIIVRSCETHGEQMVCEAEFMEKLIILLRGPSDQKDACLHSIAAIVKNNPEVSSKFPLKEKGKALDTLANLINDQHPMTRFLSCKCLIFIGHAPSDMEELELKYKLVVILTKLLGETDQAGIEVPFLLRDLIANSMELCEQAFSVNIDECYFRALERSTQAKHRVGILSVLAELSLVMDEYRGKQMVLDAVLKVTEGGPEDVPEDVRVAAWSCIRSIVKSIQPLDGGVLYSIEFIIPLFRILQDPSVNVKILAFDSLEIIAGNYYAGKSVLIKDGPKQLVQLTKSVDSIIRTKSLRMLRNLMFDASIADKDKILKELTLSTLARLIRDSEHTVQEQALGILCNLSSSECIKHIFAEDNLILDAIIKQLQNESSGDELITQGMSTLCIASTGSEPQKNILLDKILLPQADGNAPSLAIKFLQSTHDPLRVAILWFLANLAYPDGDYASSRLTRLQEEGVVSQLESMVNDPDNDVKVYNSTAIFKVIYVEYVFRTLINLLL
ncbi:hypothetical protein Cni_G20449 [Canna indica]|uniref:Armadillo repeat-containing protein 8 n=1 Tax=Canna indica TaxID=4628 RepID=A0AAQ3QKS5_9LILI|nr:hypothetical protein Cni_G20449 [Canna indica]